MTSKDYSSISSHDINEEGKHLRLELTRNADKITANLYLIRMVKPDNAPETEVPQLINLEFISGEKDLPTTWYDADDCRKWFGQWIIRNIHKI